MSKHPHPVRQQARAAIRIGPVRLRAELDLTPAGLLATGALISSILLSTAAIVHVARRGAPDGNRNVPAHR